MIFCNESSSFHLYMYYNAKKNYYNMNVDKHLVGKVIMVIGLQFVSHVSSFLTYPNWI
jgi:hypothetical protein